ncbi:hypothetical protein PMAYCL1PPCAC_16333, partial [Pristionchus mayeri]
SLCTASEGILKTHVTWEEFEANLTKALDTTARFGANKSAIDIGEGNGFASRCALIECDWTGDGAEKLPKRVVLKALALVSLSERTPDDQKMFKDATPEIWEMVAQSMRTMHNMECDTYDFLSQLGEGNAFPIRYYAKNFDDENVLKGQICMEYIENGRMMTLAEKAPLDLMKQIARALGKMQAESTKYEVVSDLLRTKDVFGEFVRNTPKEKYMTMYSPVKAIEPSLTEAVENVESLLEEYYGASVASTIHKQLGLTPVLVNGDMRTENVLIDKDSGELRALIDWQCSHFGVGVEDLLRISFFAQTTEDRRASSDDLVEEMYNAFVANLGDIPAPFTLKTLKEVYSLLFPHCALFFASGLPVLMPSSMPHPGDDSDEKKARWDVVVDKARGVLEDIVTYHEKNKS